MDNLKLMLTKEKTRLESIIQETQKQLQNAPKGTLRVTKTQNRTSYYLCADNKKMVYISKGNKELIQKLAQKTYDRRVLRCAQKQLEPIKKLIAIYDSHGIEKIFYQEHEEHKKFIVPIEPVWEQLMQSWIDKKYQGKPNKDEANSIYTNRGELVRSKSEKIIADYLYQNHIPYKYECPLYLQGFGVVYPDFTILSPKTRSEFYWEHDGKMDDPTYARTAVKKIHAYERNNIFVGEKLILTFETGETILNSKIIEQLVHKYLL